MNAAQKLKRAIEERGVMRTFISKKTGIPLDALSKTFSGKRRLTADEFIAICGALEIDMNSMK